MHFVVVRLSKIQGDLEQQFLFLEWGQFQEDNQSELYLVHETKYHHTLCAL